MSKKFFTSPCINYDFNPHIANYLCEFEKNTSGASVNKAVLLKNLLYWCSENELQNQNFRFGTFWAYQSSEWLFDKYRWMGSSRAIRRWIGELEAKDWMLSVNFNSNRYDKTKSHTLNIDKYNFVLDNRSSLVAIPEFEKWEKLKKKIIRFESERGADE